MASVAEQFWREIRDVRQPVDPVIRSRPQRRRALLVRRTRPRSGRK